MCRVYPSRRLVFQGIVSDEGCQTSGWSRERDYLQICPICEELVPWETSVVIKSMNDSVFSPPTHSWSTHWSVRLLVTRYMRWEQMTLSLQCQRNLLEAKISKLLDGFIQCTWRRQVHEMIKDVRRRRIRVNGRHCAFDTVPSSISQTMRRCSAEETSDWVRISC